MAGEATPSEIQPAAPAPSVAADKASGGPITRRWIEQRWLLDNTIRSVGMDWDQPRSIYLSAPCGPEASAGFAGLRQRITKLADASPAFEAVARPAARPRRRLPSMSRTS
jgi:hypothetical protein